MTNPIPAQAPDDPQLPPELPQSTVSEIASWLVGHTVEAVERELIRHTLESCGGDRALAAGVLGMSLPMLQKKLRGYAARRAAMPEPAEQANDNSEQEPALPVVVAAPVPAPAAAAAPVMPPPPVASAPAKAAVTTPVSVPVVAPAARVAPPAAASAPAAARGPVMTPAPAVTSAPCASAVPPVRHVPVETVRMLSAAHAPQRKPEKSTMLDFRLLIGGALAAAVVALIGVRLFSGGETGASAVRTQTPRIELSIMEKPLPEPRLIPVPAWVAPAAQAPRQAVTFDSSKDTRMDPAPAAPVVARFGRYNTEADTRMDLPPAPPPVRFGTYNTEADTRMDPPAASPIVRFGSYNTEQDTRMDPPPAPPARAAAPRLTDIAASEAASAAADTTGSITAVQPVVAPPVPVARPTDFAASPPPEAKPMQPVRRARPAPRAAQAPVPAPPPEAEIPSLLAPLAAILTPQAQRPANGRDLGVPYDCCTPR